MTPADCAAMVDELGSIVRRALGGRDLGYGVFTGQKESLDRTVITLVYDGASGQLLSGSFLDYAIPRADELPAIAVTSRDVPSPTNPLGVKGAGEGGTVGAPGAVIHAILDALASLGVTHLDMPATPERVWRVIQEAGAAR